MTDFPSFADFLAGLARARRRHRLQTTLGVAVIPTRTVFDPEAEALLDKTMVDSRRVALRKGKGRPPHPNSVATIRVKQS